MIGELNQYIKTKDIPEAESKTQPLKLLWIVLCLRSGLFLAELITGFRGRVEGEYYLSPLSVRSGRATFTAPSSRISLVFPTFAHVYVMMTTLVNSKKILVVPVVMIFIYMM